LTRLLVTIPGGQSMLDDEFSRPSRREEQDVRTARSDALAVHPVTNSIDRPLSRGHAVARTRAFLAGAALEQKKLPPARTAPCAARRSRPAGRSAPAADPCTSVGAGRRAAHRPLRRLRHAAATACDQRAWVVTQTAPRPTASSCELPSKPTVRTTRRCRGRSGRGAVERVGYPHRAGRDGGAGGAAADLDWQAGVAKGAMLDVGWAIAGARRCGLRR
jgi:hypothetical protein